MLTAPSTISRMYCYSQLDHHVGHPSHAEVGFGAAQYATVKVIIAA